MNRMKEQIITVEGLGRLSVPPDAAVVEAAVAVVNASYTAAGTRSVDSYGYTADWKQISERRREQVDWRCEDCRVRLNGRDRQFLDGHHRNRNKQDNSESNIVILCRLCHREQGFHWHEGDDHGLLVRDNWLDANRVITVRREEQGIVWRVTPAYKATHRSDGV